MVSLGSLMLLWLGVAAAMMPEELVGGSYRPIHIPSVSAAYDLRQGDTRWYAYCDAIQVDQKRQTYIKKYYPLYQDDADGFSIIPVWREADGIVIDVTPACSCAFAVVEVDAAKWLPVVRIQGADYCALPWYAKLWRWVWGE